MRVKCGVWLPSLPNLVLSSIPNVCMCVYVFVCVCFKKVCMPSHVINRSPLSMARPTYYACTEKMAAKLNPDDMMTEVMSR